VLIRWGLDDEGLKPLSFASIRYALAAVVLGGWVVARRRLRRAAFSIDRRTLGHLLVLGVAFYTVTQGAQFVAIANQPAATTSLVLSLTPLLIAGSAAATLGEAPSAVQWVGAGLVAAGAWAYFAGDLGATVVGMLAAVIGVGANAVSGLLGRHVNRLATTPPVVVTAISMGIGALLLGIGGIITEGVPAVTGRAWAIILWLAVVNTALAFSLWNLSMRRLSALESAGINNTMLVQIGILAWVFLSEPPGLAGLAGIGLVSVGVFLTQAGGRS
jgi:drug/metabolite transporter (DMT)-like permease